MSPVGRKARADETDLIADTAGGFVLPRLLRKPVRHARRLFSHGHLFSIPSLAIICGLLAGGAGVVWLRETVEGERFVAKASAWAGVRIADISITGARETSRIDILANLDLGEERSLFSFDAHAARESLKKLPWVADVRVFKNYPDRLEIEIVERVPFAVWQNRGELMLIERDGHPVVPFEDRFAGLPLVVGEGAEKGAADIVALVSVHPAIAAHVRAYVRVGGRRWNLALDSGQTILLPEDRLAEELAELARLQAEDDLLMRDVAQVDMRLKDRLVLRLTPEAAERRKAPARTTSGRGA